MMNVTLTGDTELIAKLRSMPQAIQDSLTKKAHELVLDLRTYIITQKLSGQVLNHRSGKLWQSLQTQVISNTNSVIGRVFSSGDIKYARIHEYGGTIPAHRIESSGAGPLAFMMGGKQVFAQYVNISDVKMPERSFMRSSLKDNRQKIATGLKEAVMEALTK